VDALNNFMSTMTDAVIQQVSKQVKKAVEAASSARPLPHFEYAPTGDTSPLVDAVLKHPPAAARRYNMTLMAAGASDVVRTTTAGSLGPMLALTIAQATDA